MSTPFLDIFGALIDVGDTVAVAFPEGRSSARLRIGKVLSFYEKEQAPYWDYRTKMHTPRSPIRKIEVEWDKSHSGVYSPDKPTKIELASSRFLKIK